MLVLRQREGILAVLLSLMSLASKQASKGAAQHIHHNKFLPTSQSFHDRKGERGRKAREGVGEAEKKMF